MSNGLVFAINAPLTGLMLRLAWDRRKISDGRGIVLLVAVLVTGLWIGSAAMNLMDKDLSLVVLFAFIILQPICGVVFAKYEVRESIE